MARAFRKVTQKDIARKAGVSQVSVSLALRNDPSLPQATKERILKIVEDMGYRPDPMLQSLTAYRIQNQEHQFQGTLAWVTNHDDPQGWNEGDLYPAYFRGASQQAEKLGYKLEPFWLADPDLSSKRASSILYSRNIQGLIINPSPANQSELQLDWNQFSVVSLGYTTVKPKFHLVAPRHFGGVTQCFEKLQSYGYQRIGMVSYDQVDDRVQRLFSGAFEAKSRLVPVLNQIELLQLSKIDEGVFLKWFFKNKPDAIIGNFYRSGSWIKRVLEGEGIHGSREVGIVGLDAWREESGVIAGIDERLEVIGKSAVDFVVGMIHRNEKGIPEDPLRLLVRSRWMDGKSAKKRP